VRVSCYKNVWDKGVLMSSMKSQLQSFVVGCTCDRESTMPSKH
jgi:hypothetical protein